MLDASEQEIIEKHLGSQDSIDNIDGERLSLILEEISSMELVKETREKVNIKSHPVFTAQHKNLKEQQLTKILNLRNEDFLNFKILEKELEKELAVNQVVESMGENLEENFQEEEIDLVLGEIRENMGLNYTTYGGDRRRAWSSFEEIKIPELSSSEQFLQGILEKDVGKFVDRFWPTFENKKKNKRKNKKSGKTVTLGESVKEVVDGSCLQEIKQGEEVVDGSCLQEIKQGEEVVDGSCLQEIKQAEEVVDGDCLQEIKQAEEVVDIPDLSILQRSLRLENEVEHKCEKSVNGSEPLSEIEMLNQKSPEKIEHKKLYKIESYLSNCPEKENLTEQVYKNIEYKQVNIFGKEDNYHNSSKAKSYTVKKKKKKIRPKMIAQIIKEAPVPTLHSINLTESIVLSNLSNAILPNSTLSDMIRDAPISNEHPMPEYEWNFRPESPSVYDHEDNFYEEPVTDVAVQVTPNSGLVLEIQKSALEEVDSLDTFSDATQTHFQTHTQDVDLKRAWMEKMAALKHFVSTALHPSDFQKHGLVHQPPPGYTYIFTLGYIPLSNEPHPIYILVPLSELDPELQKYFNSDLFVIAEAGAFLFNRWDLAQRNKAVIREQDLSLLTPNPDTWISFSKYSK